MPGGGSKELDEVVCSSFVLARAEVEKDRDPEGDLSDDCCLRSCFKTFGAFSWASLSRCRIYTGHGVSLQTHIHIPIEHS